MTVRKLVQMPLLPIMGAEGDPPPPPQTQTPAPPAPPAPPTQTLTQEQVNAIAAREKAEGKRAAEREFAEKLGVSVEEAATLIKAAKDADDAQKTEAQKAKEAADRAKADADAAAATAKQVTHAAVVQRSLLVNGAKLDRLSQAEKLVECEVGAEQAVVDAAVAKLKETLPEFFGAAPAGTPAPNGDPGGKPPAPKPNEGKYEQGLMRGLSTGPREYAFKGLDGK